jgi:hypothetical protein
MQSIIIDFICDSNDAIVKCESWRGWMPFEHGR